MGTKPVYCIRIVLFLVACVCILGCDGVLQRSRPSQEKYLARYLPEIPQDQITGLDYTYQATVGGYVSLAKVKVSDTSKLAPLWNLPEDMVFQFNADSREIEMKLLKAQLTVADENHNKSIPSWVDIDYAEPLYVHKDAVGTQRYRKIFLRKDNPEFYLIVSGD